MTTVITSQLPLVDEVLGGFSEVIGADYAAYRNHVFRVVNLSYAAGDFTMEEREKIQIAACFHDIGIWTASTLDYLPPSAQAASEYLSAAGREGWIPEVGEMIVMHHRVSACDGAVSPLVEAFRRADVADFSLGLFRMGLPRTLISALKAEFPNRGFHRRLLQLGMAWFIRHPLRPLPMFRA